MTGPESYREKNLYEIMVLLLITSSTSGWCCCHYAISLPVILSLKKDFEYCKQDSINMDDTAQNQAQIEAQHAQCFAGGTDKQYKPSFDSLISFIAGRPFACNYIYGDA